MVLPGSPPGPDFLNAVAEIQTDLSALDLLDVLLLIEQRHGRVRDTRWAPRTLDLDILLYGDEVIDHSRLKIPHSAMHERFFVLEPLAELNPAIRMALAGRYHRQMGIDGNETSTKVK
jgi:2-amino-4-hydroxy-6-hydroxymethyldihydropteridine diphosphokinase